MLAFRDFLVSDFILMLNCFFKSDFMLMFNYFFAGVTTEFLADFTGVTIVYCFFTPAFFTIPKEEGGLGLDTIVLLLFKSGLSENEPLDFYEITDFLVI